MNLNNLNTNLNNLINVNSTENSQYLTKLLKNTNSKIILDSTLLGVEPELIEKYNNYITKPIYETTEDLNEDIKKLQLENINLLKKLTSTSAKVNLMKQELQKIKKEDKGEIALLLLEVAQREEKIKKIKEINCSLKAEKSMLLGIGRGIYASKEGKNNSTVDDGRYAQEKPSLRKSLVKGKFKQAMLYAKVAEIFNCLLELPINFKEKKGFQNNNSNNNNNKNTENNQNNNNSNSIMKESKNEISSNENNFILNMSLNNNANKNFQQSSQKEKGALAPADKEANLMRMLRIIEKTIDFLLANHSNYLKDPKKCVLMEKLKIEVEKERKIRKAIETRLKDEKRREVISQAIIERNNRPLVLPNKKFGDRVKPVEPKASSKSVNKNKEEASIYDFIIYS